MVFFPRNKELQTKKVRTKMSPMMLTYVALHHNYFSCSLMASFHYQDQIGLSKLLLILIRFFSSLKAPANVETMLWTNCCGKNCFPICDLRKHLLWKQNLLPGNFFLNLFRNILPPQQMLPCALVEENFQETMFPQLWAPLGTKKIKCTIKQASDQNQSSCSGPCSNKIIP